MKKIIPLTAIAAVFSIVIAQDYTKVIHRTDGRSFAIRTTDVDSVSYVPSGQVPSEQYNWVDTIYKEIHDTLVNNYFIHDTIIQENVVLVHDTIYIDTEPKKTYTINGVEYPMPEMVDLGIKDDDGNTIYWASCNLGANSEYDTGLYFSWGDIVGYSENDNHYFDWNNYVFMEEGFGDEEHITKYYWCDHKYCYNYELTEDGYGYILHCSADNIVKLMPEDDAANIYLNGNWSIPEYEHFCKLLHNCDYSFTNNGVLFISKINSNSIFFSDTGYFDRNKKIADNYGYYWTSELFKEYGLSSSPWANTFRIEKNIELFYLEPSWRYNGQCIRPIYK